MSAIKLSVKMARAVLRVLDGEIPGLADGDRVAKEIRRQLAPKSPKKREASKARRQRRESKTKAKRDQTAEVRAAVMARAGMICECGCGRWFRGFMGAAQLDHFEGRGRSESVETCWALRADCHRRKTLNDPNAGHWLFSFADHCARHGYATEARRARDRFAFVAARTELAANATEPKP